MKSDKKDGKTNEGLVSETRKTLEAAKSWVIEDAKRLCEKDKDFTEKFVKLSRDVHFLNDDRAKIKLEINEHTGTKIKEIKEKIASKIKKISNNFSDFVCLIFFNIFKKFLQLFFKIYLIFFYFC